MELNHVFARRKILLHLKNKKSFNSYVKNKLFSMRLICNVLTIKLKVPTGFRHLFSQRSFFVCANSYLVQFHFLRSSRELNVVSHKIKMIQGPDLLNTAFDLHMKNLKQNWWSELCCGYFNCKSNTLFDNSRPQAILILCEPPLTAGCSQNNGTEPHIFTKEDTSSPEK